MVDQNQFINTYIDIIISSLQDYIKANLQLQTQVKVNSFVVADKDRIIADLNSQLSENKIAEDWKIKYEAAETNYNNILGKVRHMDLLLTQVTEMKKEILSKDATIASLEKELESYRPSKKVINTKTKKKEELPLEETSVLVQEVKPETLSDDF